MFGRDISSAKQKPDRNDRRFWLNINYDSGQPRHVIYPLSDYVRGSYA